MFIETKSIRGGVETALSCLLNQVLVFDILVHHLFSLEHCGIRW